LSQELQAQTDQIRMLP